MNENDYAVLLTLYKEKNITQAAKKLFISQPALTKKIKKIENELNAQIIIRSQQGIVFTPIGEQLILFVEKIHNEIRDMKDFVDNMSTEVRGTLRLGVSSIYAHYELPGILAGYLHKYPKVDLSIEADNSSSIYKHLQSNKISAAILRSDYDWQSGKILIFEEPVCLAYRRKVRYEELRNLPYVKYTTSPLLQSQLEYWLNENNIREPQNGIRTNNIDTCVQLIKKGIGWSILPYIALQDYDGYIEKLTWKNGSSYTRKTFLYYRGEHITLSAVSTFV
ncbi:MAG: LysR family transcriptional regulator, partial [Thermotaleaceae bacterium]